MQISRGKLDRLHRTPAESTALALMGTGLRRSGPARPTRDASYSVSVRQVAALLPRFFQTAPRGHRPCASLALHPHQILGRGLSPPSCQTCSAHTSLWKPNNGFHRDLEISHRTRDSHIPTSHPHPSDGREKGHRDGESDLVLTSIGRRIVAASATLRTGKNTCRQTAKVVDVDHGADRTGARRRSLRDRGKRRRDPPSLPCAS
jgi:hypothetical protein